MNAIDPLENNAVDRIKVLFIVNSLAIGGAEIHLINLLTQLDKKLFEPTICYLKKPASLLHKLIKIPSLTILPGDVEGKGKYHAFQIMRQYVASAKIELIVAVNCYALIFATALRFSFHRHISVVDIFHTSQVFVPSERRKMSIFKHLFRYCDEIIFVCDWQMQFWEEHGIRCKNSRVIFNGVDTHIFKNRNDPERAYKIRNECGFSRSDFIIGVCAALRPEKAHGDMIDALHSLGVKFKNVKCLIIGDGPEYGRVVRSVHKHGLMHKVRVIGARPDPRPYLAICDVIALVSRCDTFPLASLEAMAMSKPVLLSRVGGASEQIIHGVHGLFYRAGDMHELALRIVELIQRVDIKRLGVQARDRVISHFSQEKMISEYENAFVENVSRKKHGFQ
jgi:glycosyltransferase involved in cell wall biosynthesis